MRWYWSGQKLFSGSVILGWIFQSIWWVADVNMKSFVIFSNVSFFSSYSAILLGSLFLFLSSLFLSTVCFIAISFYFIFPFFFFFGVRYSFKFCNKIDLFLIKFVVEFYITFKGFYSYYWSKLSYSRKIIINLKLKYTKLLGIIMRSLFSCIGTFFFLIFF